MSRACAFLAMVATVMSCAESVQGQGRSWQHEPGICVFHDVWDDTLTVHMFGNYPTPGAGPYLEMATASAYFELTSVGDWESPIPIPVYADGTSVPLSDVFFQADISFVSETIPACSCFFRQTYTPGSPVLHTDLVLGQYVALTLTAFALRTSPAAGVPGAPTVQSSWGRVKEETAR